MSYPTVRRAATIEDVAREAGVSRAAVSKVLRNAYGVVGDDERGTGLAMQHLLQLGHRRIAHLVSVAGYDDVRMASHPTISLTTVDQAGVAMGARAITMLLERIGGRVEPVHEVTEPTLQLRASTRPPASQGGSGDGAETEEAGSSAWPP